MTSDYKYHSPVYISDCDSYSSDQLYSIFKKAFSDIGITNELIHQKKICLKPNLVLAKKPKFAVTTHPSFISAIARLLKEMGASEIILADSPGGPFNFAALANIYRICEMNSVSDIVKLNDDFTWSEAHIGGVRLKNVHIISAIQKSDVVIDLCKLKTHSLTGLSCAVKNLFGVIPGVEKFEMHSSYPVIDDFSDMLVDLSSYIVENKTFIAVCDAVLSMERNGPTHGMPKKTGLVLMSRSPYSLDVVAEHIMKLDRSVLHLTKASERGFMPRDFSEIEVIGKIECPTFNFARPDSDAGHFLRNLSNFMGGRFAKIFETKPKINLSKCIGCGVCASSCPRHTISVEKKTNSKKYAKIDRSDCIRCFCCQELCPIGAVDIKQNFLIKIIH